MSHTEAHAEPCQTSKTWVFTIVVKIFQVLTETDLGLCNNHDGALCNNS